MDRSRNNHSFFEIKLMLESNQNLMQTDALKWEVGFVYTTSYHKQSLKKLQLFSIDKIYQIPCQATRHIDISQNDLHTNNVTLVAIKRTNERKITTTSKNYIQQIWMGRLDFSAVPRGGNFCFRYWAVILYQFKSQWTKSTFRQKIIEEIFRLLFGSFQANALKWTAIIAHYGVRHIPFPSS